MRVSFYTGKEVGDQLVITARSPTAKQLFFSWASDLNADDMIFYGRPANKLSGARPAGHELWKWTLTSGAASTMMANIIRHIDDPSYYKGREKLAAEALLKLLAQYFKDGAKHLSKVS